MSNWKENALDALRRSLYPLPQELNEIDWKGGLSNKTDRLAQHLCAFSNLKGGGVMLFCVNDDATFEDVTKGTIEEVTTKLGNIAKNNLAWPIQLEHTVQEFDGHALLFVRIPEQQNKPVYLRGRDIYEAYIRSAGHTVKMSREQVHEMLAQSHGLTFEKRVARGGISVDLVLELLDYKKLYELMDRKVPQDMDRVIEQMLELGMIERQEDLYNILNLGAILFAHKLNDFGTLATKEVIARKYAGSNNRVLSLEYKMTTGYAVGLEDLIDTVMQFTGTEFIEVKRTSIPTYPRVAIRELVTNLCIHQDFAISGMPITIEVFDNRLVMTNPGSCLNDVNRLIDLPPHSRNEAMAQLMLQLDLCERRGSGYDRAVEAIEAMLLPAYKVQSGYDYTRVFLYPKKDVKEMTKEERIQACYQHTCLLYEDKMAVTNQTMRQRFGLDAKGISMISHIIADTLECGLIKYENPEMSSKRYATYIPFYG